MHVLTCFDWMNFQAFCGKDFVKNDIDYQLGSIYFYTSCLIFSAFTLLWFHKSFINFLFHIWLLIIRRERKKIVRLDNSVLMPATDEFHGHFALTFTVP